MQSESQPERIESYHIDCIKQGALVSIADPKSYYRYDQRAARQVPDLHVCGPGRLAGRS